MKELSIEQKAKAYDEVSKEVKDYFEGRQKMYSDVTQTLEYLFPELKESEDERIRKEIIDFLELPHPQFVGKRDHEKWIAWLEKQGEQNPTNKVEPKFKVGDWVVNKLGDLWHIDSSDKKNYQVSDGKGNYNYFPISKQEELRLWTIQDAKDGDMLEFGDHGRLVTGILSFVNKTTGKIDVSCLLEGDKFKVGVFYNLDTVKPHPATKEQRDLLFKKMKEAGYEWDSEKKELKKIEQKQIINYPDNLPKDNWELIHEFVNKFGRIPKDEDELNVLIEYVLKRQKPAWSEEDDKILKSIIINIENLQFSEDMREKYHHILNTNKSYYQIKIDWLESLKDRVQPQPKQVLDFLDKLRTPKDRVQPKQEWSEEDEKMIEICVGALRYSCYSIPSVEKAVNWLKSLRLQNTWKPSEEQMEALNGINVTGGVSYAGQAQELRDLYNDLKKLREK